MTESANTYETVVSHLTVGHDKDKYVIIETSEKSVISALKRKPDAFEVVWETDDEHPVTVRFRIPWGRVSWGGLAKRAAKPLPEDHPWVLRRSGVPE